MGCPQAPIGGPHCAQQQDKTHQPWEKEGVIFGNPKNSPLKLLIKIIFNKI